MIGAERTDDAPAVDAVVRRAFHENVGVADMVAAIRASAQYEPDLTLVAKQAGQVVGFVMISHVELIDDDARHDALTLSPLAVHPDHERRGIGSALVRAVLSRAEAASELPRFVTLEGSPHYYGRLGFEFAPAFGVTFDLPEWAPREAAQVFRLTGHDPAVRGRVCYPAAFTLAASRSG
jgi:putative acetyltransferase